jgi:16S rRNA (uracil1498-N3)-methyltransferase
MHRFFIESGHIKKGIAAIIDRQQVHHIKDVVRLVVGEQIVVCDQEGNEYTGTVQEILCTEVRVRIEHKLPDRCDSALKITVACAIPKQSRFDDIIEKLTQLGIDKIIPMETQRVIIKLDDEKRAQRHKRWQQIALSASKQSQRRHILQVTPVTAFHKVIGTACDYDCKIIPVLFGERKTLSEIFKNSRPRTAFVLIGPEGDFSPDELARAQRAGFVPVSLGDLVLRVETAAVAVASFLRLMSISS